MFHVKQRERIEIIRARLLTKEITYDEAKELAQPIIEEMNSTARDIAKKHGARPRKFSFSGLMR